MQTQLTFILCTKVPEIPGVGIVVECKPPFNVGKPIRFDSVQELEIFLRKYKLLDRVGYVKGYKMLVVWIGTLDNIFTEYPSGDFISEGQRDLLQTMADWYFVEAIEGQESRLKKYLR